MRQSRLVDGESQPRRSTTERTHAPMYTHARASSTPAWPGERRETRGGTHYTRMVSLSLNPTHYKENSRRPSRHSACAASRRVKSNAQVLTACADGSSHSTHKKRNAIETRGQTHAQNEQANIRTQTHTHTQTKKITHAHTHTQPPSPAAHTQPALCHEPRAGEQPNAGVKT